MAGDVSFGEGKEEIALLEHFSTIFSLLLCSPAVCSWVRDLQMTLRYIFEKKLSAAFRVVHRPFLLTMVRIALKFGIVWLKLLLQNLVLLWDVKNWGFDPGSV